MCVCSAGYAELPVVLLYSGVSASMLGVSHAAPCPKREETLEVYTAVIGEIVMLGLLEVVYKIPYSSCIFNTAVVLEPGKM